jgi:bis(5'-adenosyl)-triphosphatase
MNEESIPLDTCPFCSVDNQGIAFASSLSFLAIYNIAPILPGHSLIVPRIHVKSLRSLNDELISELFLFARRVTDTLLTYYNADAFDWSLQDNDAAGQTVQHLHLHILVRHPLDLADPGDWYPMLDNHGSSGSSDRLHLDHTAYSQIVKNLKAAFIELEAERLRKS